MSFLSISNISSSHTLPPSRKTHSRSALSESSQGKRKFPPEFEAVDSRSRPRLDERPQYNSWAPQPNDHRKESGGPPQHVGNWPPQLQGGPESTLPDSITHQRLSNVRTPVDHDAHEQHLQYHCGVDARRVSVHVPGVGVGQMPPIHQPGNPVVPPQHPQSQYQEAPRISLDLNALSAGREIDGLPFSGYDFLGGDVYALLGSVFRPQNEQLPAQYEENGQILWQAYGQADSHLGQEQR
jgi:hypothetical protein